MKDAQIPDQSKSADAVKWLGDYGDALYRYAMQRVHDADAAEDLVQDTLLAAMVLKHKLVDKIRKSIHERPLAELRPEDDVDLFDENGKWTIRIAKWQADPHETMESAEFQKVLASCLSKLPLRMAQVFWLHEAESMDSKQLCKELEISPTNVWTLLHRARLRLQRCLTLNWFEGDDI
jgi:RNA polymerase sigma-70 factor (ECF subfamily)